MRLIDADALKEVIHSKSDGMEDLWDTAGVLNAINCSPTVEPDISEIEEKFWHRCGFLQGYTTGLKDKERPQGDLISRREAEELGATCLARRNENGQLEAIISLDLLDEYKMEGGADNDR